MIYKLTKENLKKAVNEAVNKKRNQYQKLNFINSILKEYPEFQNRAKSIIKSKRDNGKTLYNYLLKECGCGSKYNKIAEYIDYKNEDELLYDDSVNEYYDDPSQDYDYERNEDERWDFDIDEWNDDEELDANFYDEEKPIVTEMPKYWVAEKDGRKKYTECSGLNEIKVKEEIEKMEKSGHKVTAFTNEANMQKYLSK